MSDWFAGALTSEDDLAGVYEPAEARTWRKDIGQVDELAARLIAATPIVMVATYDSDPELTLEQVEQQQRESVLHRLA